MIRAVVAIGVAGALGLGGALVWWQHALSPAQPGGEAVVVELEPGTSLARVARTLEQRGVVRDARAFEWLGRLRDAGHALRAGEYELDPGATAEEILDQLVRGAVRTHAVSIPEGLRVEEVAARLGEAGLADPDAFVAFARAPGSAERLGVEGPGLEGYLFPETYRLAKGLPVEDVAHAMVEQFLEIWSEIRAEAAAAGLSMREVATLASIVEKETGAEPERPLIAAVFRNRLERGMRLETDPTVIYGIPDFDGNLRRVHLEDETNPYNTYRIPGLPPGPIANAGADALRAVVRPADSDYLFFVSRNDGTHHFSATFREHTAAVDEYQRGGRRPRAGTRTMESQESP